MAVRPREPRIHKIRDERVREESYTNDQNNWTKTLTRRKQDDVVFHRQLFIYYSTKRERVIRYVHSPTIVILAVMTNRRKPTVYGFNCSHSLYYLTKYTTKFPLLRHTARSMLLIAPLQNTQLILVYTLNVYVFSERSLTSIAR